MLGDAFYEQFRASYDLKCTDIDVNETWLSYCDFRDWTAYRRDVTEFRPDFLFHLGALTDVEYCELHPDDAYQTNTLGVENAVFIAEELKIPLVYIGTAGIFDGGKEEYDEWDTPNPIGHYSRSKYAGERAVIERAERFYICRAGWMMGGGPRKDKKFVHKVMRQLREGCRELFIVNDQFGALSYTHDFARTVKGLIETPFTGIYNVVCNGATSRLDVTRELLQILGLTDTVKITEVTFDFFREEYFVPRPLHEGLVNKKLKLRGLDRMRDWRVAMREYIESQYAGFLK